MQEPEQSFSSIPKNWDPGRSQVWKEALHTEAYSKYPNRSQVWKETLHILADSEYPNRSPVWKETLPTSRWLRISKQISGRNGNPANFSLTQNIQTYLRYERKPCNFSLTRNIQTDLSNLDFLFYRGEYVIYREEEVSSPGLKTKKSSRKILKA